MVKKYDFLVIGSGIAGMSFALKVASKGKVALLCKTDMIEANTNFAQGGICCVMKEDDKFENHIKDTLIAGDGICDYNVVKKVVEGAPEQIKELVKWGVDFDKNEDGKYDLHKEGGHDNFRILHHKDNTGAEIQESLVETVKKHPNIDVMENHFAIELLTQHHLGMLVKHTTPNIDCYGAYVLDIKKNCVDTYLAKITMVCTGGIGNIYQTTTNPPVATGDGISMVYRAKVFCLSVLLTFKKSDGLVRLDFAIRSIDGSNCRSLVFEIAQCATIRFPSIVFSIKSQCHRLVSVLLGIQVYKNLVFIFPRGLSLILCSDSTSLCALTKHGEVAYHELQGTITSWQQSLIQFVAARGD